MVMVCGTAERPPIGSKRIRVGTKRCIDRRIASIIPAILATILEHGVRVNLAVEVIAKRFPIHPHLVFETLAYLIAFQVYRFLRKNYGDPVSISSRWSIIAAAAVGAALGSKLLFLVEDPSLTLAHISYPAFLMGGKTIVGGLVGGLIAVELIKKIAGIRERTGDLFVVPLCVGIAVGRIGCFLSGLADNTYGTATSLPWGV